MPDLTVETILICPQWASNFQVKGSEDNEYNVTINPYDPASCTCPSFKYSGEYGNQKCKHITKVMAKGCFFHPQYQVAEYKIAWNGFNFHRNGIEWLNSGGDVANPPRPCPGCGNPMIVTKVAV